MEQDTNVNANAPADDAGGVGSEHEHGEARPEGMPEDGNPKFFNTEKGEYNWAAHARDAEWRLAQSRKDSARNAEERADATGLYLEDEAEGGEEGEGEASSPRIDLKPFMEEFSQYGDLSDASYAKLDAMGLPRDLVESYAANQGAAAERTKAEIVGVVGGEDQYAAMINWAASELSPEDVEAFNALANGKDMKAFKLAVRGVHEQYLEAVGRPAARRITGDGGGGGSGDVYDSWAQVTADMRDNRYKTDPQYREAVTRKLDRSPLQGVNLSKDKVYRS